MGKVKTVIMGDEQAEEAARKKAEIKREQKKLAEGGKKKEEVTTSATKTDAQKAQDILKMMETDTTKAQVVKEEQKKETEKATKLESKEHKKKESKEAEKPEVSDKPKAKHGKKYQAIVALVEKNKTYSLSQAIELVKKTSYSKFDGSFEAHFNVAAKGLRGSVSLPHGIGKEVKVAIADDKLVDEIASTGKYDFDVLVAHPSMMPKLAKVAKILGPKGLMPNPKTGTIGDKPEELAKKLSAGQTNWKTEQDFPIIHTILGKVSFDNKKIDENYSALVKAIGKDKIKSVFVKATMGPSIKVAV